MSTREQRFDERFRCEIPVTMVWNRQRARLSTVDVGYRGMFLRTDAPPTLRQLLRIEVALPDGDTLALHGMAVHVVHPGSGRAPGVGVQFYAVDQALSARWARFIDGVKRDTRSLPEVTAPVYQRPAAIPPLPRARRATSRRPEAMRSVHPGGS